MGPPSSGRVTVAQILGLLEGFDLAAIGPTSTGWRLFTEAAKLAYADRNLYIADPDFAVVPTQGLLDPAYLAHRTAAIDPDGTTVQAVAGRPPQEESTSRAPQSQEENAGTSHFVIADRYGDMTSMTTTIEAPFGSRVMTNGFLLNNQLTDFSFAPERDGAKVTNRVEGGKRPRSSMAPTIVLKDGEPILLISSPGGSRIINDVAGALIAILDWGMTPQQALDMGHVVNQNGVTELEEGTEAVALTGTLGHRTTIRPLESGLHAILIEDGALRGVANRRRDGVVLGE